MEANRIQLSDSYRLFSLVYFILEILTIRKSTFNDARIIDAIRASDSFANSLADMLKL